MNIEEAVQICPTPAALVARDTRRADEVTTQIKKLDGLSQHSTFDQADLFAEVKKQSHWATAGYEDIDEYYKELGIDKSKREIQYLTRMSEVLASLGTTRGDAVAAKVSKLRLICQLDPTAEVVDPDTEVVEPMEQIMRRLITAAPFTSLSELKQIVDDLLGKSGEEGSELTWFNWPIRKDAKEVVMNAINLAKALSGDTVDVVTKEVKDLSDAAALERVAADFLADPNNHQDDLGTAGDFEDSVESGDERDAETV